MKITAYSPSFRRMGLGGGLIFIVIICILGSTIPSNAIIKPHANVYQTTDDLKEARNTFSASDVEKMTYQQYTDHIDKIEDGKIDHSEHGYDDAAYYYSEIKAKLHDRQASQVSQKVLKQLQTLRKIIIATEVDTMEANYRSDLGSIYVHTTNRYSANREDKIGDLIKPLSNPGKSKISRAVLLTKIRAFDKNIPGKSKPYLKLAATLTSYPDNVIEAVYKLEVQSIDVIKQALSDSGG